MMKAGVVVDNYKVEKFKSALGSKNFTYEVLPFDKDSTLIQVNFHPLQLKDLKKLCTEAELAVKRSN